MRKQYYQRMLAFEKLAYVDPEKRVQMSFENRDFHSSEAPRRVRFSDADIKKFPQDAKGTVNPNNKQDSTRIRKLETEIELRGKNQPDSRVNEWSEGDSLVGIRYPESGEDTVANGEYSAHAVGASDVAASFNKSSGQEVKRNANDNDDGEEAMFNAGDHSFAIMCKSLREEQSSFW